ncbi:hypothetical protein [Micromonospora aurantiaca]|uniref:hypothetical protein n=1 Tax=Micromonospora aurantiaca (nom. illeg.) TaxID=47850 RepID=UPI0014777E69|nr:hypothetical protein [Micromonospora aurantiaca]
MPAASPRSVPCWVLEWVAGGSRVLLPPALVDRPGPHSGVVVLAVTGSGVVRHRRP